MTICIGGKWNKRQKKIKRLWVNVLVLSCPGRLAFRVVRACFPGSLAPVQGCKAAGLMQRHVASVPALPGLHQLPSLSYTGSPRPMKLMSCASLNGK